MHCEKITIKNGQVRWICVEDGPPNPVTGKRNQIKRRGKTRKEAKAKVEYETAKQSQTGVNAKEIKGVTFDRLALKWLEMYKLTSVKKATIETRLTQLNKLNENMAKVPIDKLSHLFYQNIINNIATKSARDSVLGIQSCANLIFKFAVKYELMTQNPAAGVMIPKKAKTVEDLQKDSIEEKYWEREELDAFLSSSLKCGLELDKERFFTLAFSGMRVSELCALQKNDLDFENNVISVTKTITGHGESMRGYELGTPKNGSARTLEMEEPIMDMLREQVRKNDEHKMKYRLEIEDFHDMDFVFPHKNGYPYSRGDVNYRIKHILKKAKIERHASSHIFRHTHISMLTEAEVDLPTIMERVGHSDPKTTLKIYTHVTKKMKANASEKVRGKFDDLLQKIAF
jgi:integrase